MQKITRKFVEKLNEEVSSDNFEQIIDKYQLETPEEYLHTELYEQDGIEVWGISETGYILVYDNTNGFYLLSKEEWIQEIRKQYEEGADSLLKEMGIIKPIYHEFRIIGLEATEKRVVSGNNTSARINVPADKIGKRVMVVWLE